MHLINHTVSSDCKPLYLEKRIVSSDETGLIQTDMDETWFEEIGSVYSNYEIYKQSKGKEQATYSPLSGFGEARSSRIVNRLAEKFRLPSKGKALDYGCGNGGFLKVLSNQMEGWDLYGSEYDDKDEDQVRAIPGVRDFFVMQEPGGEEKFDLISLVHVLEHIPNPHDFVLRIKEILKPDGLLLIQLPYHVDNPFELSIYDHATHFTLNSIRNLLESCGIEIRILNSEWVSKEISIVGAPSAEKTRTGNCGFLEEDLRILGSRIDYLNAFAHKAKEQHRTSKRNAIFGSSIAASWLYSHLEGQIDYFVDEDASRHGNTHLDVEIIPPESLPDGTALYVAQPPVNVDSIARRLENLMKSGEIVIPSPF